MCPNAGAFPLGRRLFPFSLVSAGSFVTTKVKKTIPLAQNRLRATSAAAAIALRIG